MLDNLKEIECAYSLLKSSSGGGEDDPIDAHYKSLNTKIEPLDPKAEEFDLIKQYTKNTHGKTHSSYDLHVDEVMRRAVIRQRFFSLFGEIYVRQGGDL